MGTFASYNGNMEIPEEKREIFAEQMLKILNYGGMLQFERVNIYGKQIALIKPPEPDADGELEFHYNYFEDDGWESAHFNTNDVMLYTNKIGSDEFNWAIRAAYSLYEAYDEGVGRALQDMSAIDAGYCIGWINHILGTNFTIKNRFRLWEYFERENLSDEYTSDFTIGAIVQSVPVTQYKGLGGIEFADICYILEGTKDLEEEILVKGSYPEMILKARKALQEYYAHNDNKDEKQHRLWQLLVMTYKERNNVSNELSSVAELSLHLPARVFVYLTAELLESNFWELWAKLKDDVYLDEDVSGYASKDVIEKREEFIKALPKEVTTVDFFYNDGIFTFWGTPDSLKSKPNYYISNDERAYWWNEEEDFFSDEMEEWLNKIGKQHKELLTELSIYEIEEKDFLKETLDVLFEVNAYYKRVYAYRDMFYEFLMNFKDANYYAAIKLLKRLSDENKEDGKIIDVIRHSWSTESKNVIFNAGRRRMKRYLAVMANKKLRRKYFGF